MPDQPEHDLNSWSELLKTNWEKRAQSDSRDFYVASHPGWDQPELWEAQGRQDVELVTYQLDADWLAGVETFEIGCGVGRLAAHFLDRTKGYTGVDVSPGMVAEARNRVPPPARFFESDGVRAPDAVRDRKYGLILAWAVFIHCPKDVIESLARDAMSLLAPGGHFRFQLLGDIHDPTGLQEPPDMTEAAHDEMVAMEAAATDTDRALIDDHYYMGHAFRFDEAQELLGSLGGTLTLYRFDLAHMYGDVTLP